MNDTQRRPEAATPAAAILLVFGAGLIFSFLDTSAKYLASTGMSPLFVGWSRFATHVVIALLLLRAWNNPAMFRYANLPLQMLRGLFLSGATIFNFFALQTLQLAEAVSIFFFAPMVITALAGPLLGEWAGWRRWMAVIVGFAGVLIIVRPGYGEFVIGHLYVVFAMLSYCFYVIMTRWMSASESAESLIFYSALTAALVLLPAVPFYGTLPTDGLQWAILLSLGIYGGVGHWMLIKAYKLATTSALAPYPYLQMVWMVALGYLVFGDLPDRWTIGGAIVIVLSGLYIVHRERQLRLQNTSAPNTEDQNIAKKL